MKHIAKCNGVCADLIQFEILDGKVHNLAYYGGDPCPGGSQALAKLSEGREAIEVASILSGNDCYGRGTSCADQFAKAIERALEAEAAGTVLSEGTIAEGAKPSNIK